MGASGVRAISLPTYRQRRACGAGGRLFETRRPGQVVVTIALAIAFACGSWANSAGESNPQLSQWSENAARADVIEEIIKIIKDILNPPPPDEEPGDDNGW